jgi:hypothetical protein
MTWSTMPERPTGTYGKPNFRSAEYSVPENFHEELRTMWGIIRTNVNTDDASPLIKIPSTPHFSHSNETMLNATFEAMLTIFNVAKSLGRRAKRSEANGTITSASKKRMPALQ